MYAALCRYRRFEGDEEGTGYPSIDRISETSKVGRATVIKAIRELTAFGLLEVYQEKTGSRYNNSYYMPDIDYDEPPYWLPTGDVTAYIDRRERRRKQAAEASQKGVEARKQSVANNRGKDASTANDTGVSTDNGTGLSIANDTGPSIANGTVTEESNRVVEQRNITRGARTFGARYALNNSKEESVSNSNDSDYWETHDEEGSDGGVPLF